MEITAGMTGSKSLRVQQRDTAEEIGSGSLSVLATPCMIALMEGASCAAIEKGLSAGKTTVGISMNIDHTAPTPVGLNVTAEATVIDIQGKMITFSVHAYDEKGEIGRGIHKRCIVDSQRFLQKAYEKI